MHHGLRAEPYKLWLDDSLPVHTCADWREVTTSLEQVKRQMIDHVCRKIRPAPREDGST